MKKEGLPAGAGALQGFLQPSPLGREARLGVEDEDLELPEPDPVVGPFQAEALKLRPKAWGIVVAEGGVEGGGGKLLQEGLHHGAPGVEVVPRREEGGEGAMGVLPLEECRHLGPPRRGRPPVPQDRKPLAQCQGEEEEKGEKPAQGLGFRGAVGLEAGLLHPRLLHHLLGHQDGRLGP